MALCLPDVSWNGLFSCREIGAIRDLMCLGMNWIIVRFPSHGFWNEMSRDVTAPACVLERKVVLASRFWIALLLAQCLSHVFWNELF